jgi:hypothetical protein
VQQRTPKSAGPSREIFHVHTAKPFHQDLRIAKVGPPPEIEVRTGNRQLRQPGRDRRATLLQLIERSHDGVTSLRDLMRRQYDGREKNETGQQRKQQRSYRWRTASEDKARETNVDWPSGDGDHRRPGQRHQKIASDPKRQKHYRDRNDCLGRRPRV